MRAMIFGASLIAFSASASPAATSAPPPKSPHVSVLAKSPPDMTALLRMFDKFFPPQPEPEPARLALARTSAAAIWANGSYGKMMTGMMGGVFDRVMQMKPSDLGLPSSKEIAAYKPNSPGKANEPSIHDQAVAKDPYFEQRAAAVKQVVVEEAAQISAIIDPRIRNGLARSMARRFDARQLADINAFFATPSGQALASQYMQMWVDPDVMRGLLGSMPEMIKLMPDMIKKVKAASDRYPAPPKPPGPKATPPKSTH